MLFSTLAGAFSHATTTQWMPQKVWSHSGGDWTVLIGANGTRAVFIETAKADFNRLFRALV